MGDPYEISGAYDVDRATTFDSLTAFAAEGGQKDLIVFSLLMVTRVEAAVWLAMGLMALFVLVAPGTDRRTPVFVAFIIAGICAGAVHLNHSGLLGERPAYALDHPFNMALIVADGGAAVLGLACLLSGGGSKVKS